MFKKTNSLMIAALIAASAAMSGVAEARTNGGANGAGAAGQGDNGPEIRRDTPEVKISIKRRPTKPMPYRAKFRDCRDLVEIDATCPQGR